MSGPAATSVLKAAYFGDWRMDALLHVMDIGGGLLGAAAGMKAPREINAGERSAHDLVDAFNPQAILYRPVADSQKLHDFAMAAIDAGLAKGAGLALWIMDDWPARLEKTDPELFRLYDRDLRTLFSKAHVNFAISGSMAQAFAERYGAHFKVAHNGVDPVGWPRQARKRKKRVIIRYAGSLAPDMTRQSVVDVARTISRLALRGEPVRFEGLTHSHWMRECGETLNAMHAVSFRASNLSEVAYKRWLSNADILLIAYNFDEATRTYIKYSFPNKLPEVMAAGAAIIAYGPEDLEAMACLRLCGAALMVTQKEEAALENAILSLVRDRSKRLALGAAARKRAFEHFAFGPMKARFKQDLFNIIDMPGGSGQGGASHAIGLTALPYPSTYRRFVNAVHDKAPLIFMALQPIARGLRAILAPVLKFRRRSSAAVPEHKE